MDTASIHELQLSEPRRHRSLFVRGLVACTSLVLLGVISYAPVLECGFIWDDDDYVLENETLRSVEGLNRIWFDWEATPQYYPLVHTTYWIEYQLWGLSATGYHATNIALHVLAALILWRILNRLALPGAWVVAAVFAVHPVHVETVAWITERKNVLSAFFYMASARAYLAYALPQSTKTRRWLPYGAALVLFVCALLSKTVACSLPAAILLVLWWKRAPIGWREILALVPFFAAGFGFAMVTAWLEKVHVGASGDEWSLSFLQRCLIAGNALWFYGGKIAWPTNLTFIYPRWTIDVHDWSLYVYPVLFVAVTVLLAALVRRIGRGPLVAVLFFAGTLLPALGFFDIYPMRYSFVADHFQYVASIGLIALSVSGAVLLARSRVTIGRPVAAVALIALLATFGTLTRRQTRVYQNLETLWTDVLTKNPSAWLAHNNLGLVLQAKGDLGAAEDHYNAALELKPDYPLAHHNLGNVYSLRGSFRGSIGHYRNAIRLKPDYAAARNNLAKALRRLGQTEEAIGQLRTAIETDPQYIPARLTLAGLYRERGAFADALEHYRAAVAVVPTAAIIRHELGMTYLFSGDAASAIEQLRIAVGLDPNAFMPLSALARVLATTEDDSLRNEVEALDFAKRSSELTGGTDPIIEDTLAAALAANARFEEAVKVAGRARQLALKNGDQGLARDIGNHKRLYEAGRPLR